MDTDHSAITEPVRRLELFTGAGRRRTWLMKTRPGLSPRLRRGGEDSPQQLFGWRRQLRESEAAGSDAEELQFVPAIVDVGSSAVGATAAAAGQSRDQCRSDRDRWRNDPARPQRGCRDFDDGAACVESRRAIGPRGAVRVMVATKPVDFRKGAAMLAVVSWPRAATSGWRSARRMYGVTSTTC